MKTRHLATVAMAATLTACASQKANTPDTTTSASQIVKPTSPNRQHPRTTMEVKAVDMDYDSTDWQTSESVNKFAVNLFEKINDGCGDESVITSPLGVTYVLAMLDNGAKGSGRHEIDAALGLGDETAEALNDLSKKMIYNTASQKASATLNIANYLALNQGFTLKTPYKERMEICYEAGVETMDFSKDAAARKINDWCAENTDGMIAKFLDSTDPSASAYVLNAIYFNGKWQHKFSASATKEETFTAESGTERKVKMMHQNTKLDYAENDTVKLLAMPYGEGDYEMIVALPQKGFGIADAIGYLKGKTIGDIHRTATEYKVDVKLPKFTIETKTTLKETLGKLGIKAIFNDNTALADISQEPLVVSQVLQKAKIEVSEEGTKAAAVTGAILMKTSLAPQETLSADFHADHPFVYMIVDNSSQAILFMGAYK